MNIAIDTTSQKTCPECGSDVPVHEGVRTWCERCDWNVGGAKPQANDGFFARQYVRVGERHGKRLLEALKATAPDKLRPRRSVSKGTAFLLASCVHLVSLLCFAAGLALVIFGYPAITLMICGIVFMGFAWVIRPKPGKPPVDDVAAESEFPALYALANKVADAVGGKPIRHIIINEDFNASYGVYGWRRTPVLSIGLPL
jgi:hypothetical protein